MSNPTPTLGEFLARALASNPSCRITINASRPIKSYSIGSIRIIGGRVKVKRQRSDDTGAHYVRRGKPVTEWFELDETHQSMAPNEIPPKSRFGKGRRVLVLIEGEGHEGITGKSVLRNDGWFTEVTIENKLTVVPERLLTDYHDRRKWEIGPFPSSYNGPYWCLKTAYQIRREAIALSYTVEEAKAVVPYGWTYYGRGELAKLQPKDSIDVGVWVPESKSWSYDLKCRGNRQDFIYIIRNGTEAHSVNLRPFTSRETGAILYRRAGL